MPEEKAPFPNIPATHWWKLRDKFKQSIPTTVTPGYIAAALSMKENSAKANIMPPLIAFGIIDENGKPKDRAISWRDDEKYPGICEEIRNEIYPEELLEALPPPNPDRDSVNHWFANRTGSGEVAVKKMTATYLLLCEADPLKTQEVTKKVQSSTKREKIAYRRDKDNAQSRSIRKNIDSTKIGGKTIPQITSPSIHIDIQIHISPDTSPELIDKIFTSMAKHLYLE